MYDTLFDVLLDKDNAKYIIEFDTDPMQFLRSVKELVDSEPFLKTVQSGFGKDNIVPMVGGLVQMASSTGRPFNDEQGLSLNTDSSNAAYTVYKNKNDQMVFIKVALPDKDAFELEALTLRLIQRYVPRKFQRFFLHANGSGQIICETNDTESKTLYTASQSQSVLNELGTSNKRPPKNLVNYTFLMMDAVPSGISISTITEAWADVSSKPSFSKNTLASLKVFHQNDVFEKVIKGRLSLKSRQVNLAIQRIYDKYNEFIAGVLQGCKYLNLSHGDLHNGNVMYDAVNDNFVMIDYGRAVIDLRVAKCTTNDIWNEYLKLRSLKIKMRESRGAIKRDPNSVYDIFSNFNMRTDFNELHDRFIDTFNIMLDIGGLSYTIMRDMQDIDTVISQPFLLIKENSQNAINVHVLTLREIHNALQKNTYSLFDLSMCMVSLVIHSVIVASKANPKLSYKKAFPAPKDNYYVIKETYLFDNDRANAPFFYWGQPRSLLHPHYHNILESFVQEMGLAKAIERALSLKSIDLKHGGAGTSSVSQAMATLTINNYEDSMKRRR